MLAHHNSHCTASIAIGVANAPPNIAIEEVLQNKQYSTEQHSAEKKDEGTDKVLHSQCLVRVSQRRNLLTRATQPKLLPPMELT